MADKISGSQPQLTPSSSNTTIAKDGAPAPNFSIPVPPPPSQNSNK